LYKVVILVYFTCFFCYVLFSRVPAYFEGDYTNGVVEKATFSLKENYPLVVVNYKVGNEKFQYISHSWFLTSYKPGHRVSIIYDPSNPYVACIYTFIGYWIKWPELFFTAIVFIVLFITAVLITGRNNTSYLDAEDYRKSKYDD
jgi:hypothetical protein